MRFGEAFEAFEPKVLQRKDRPDLPPGAVSYYDRVRLGQSKQPGGQIGYLAQNLRVVSRSDQVTHDHEAGGDAYPDLKRLRALQATDAFDQGQAGSHGLLGIIFMSVRVTKIDQDTVTDAAGHEAAEPGHDFCNAPVVSPDDFAKVFNIEMYGQRSRADKVAEHHRDVAALGERRTGQAWREFGTSNDLARARKVRAAFATKLRAGRFAATTGRTANHQCRSTLAAEPGEF